MRHYIDENDKLNEIRLLFRHPLYRDKVVVVVEGETDVRLFRGILESETAKIETVDGKSPLLNLMIQLSEEYPEKVLGICDADYDNLNGLADERARNSVYVTDHHDAEVMMLISPAADAFISEYASHGNIDTVREHLIPNAFDAAYELGLIRWVNCNEGLNINFKGLNFNEFVSVDSLSVSIDLEVLLDELILRSRNKKEIATKEYIISKIDEYKSSDACKLQVCCGHDVANIIAICFRQEEISLETNMDHKKVESALRIGYQREYFEKLELYSKIKAVTG
ncbi:DUF4435 domain-containing protein [Halomonas sp. MCCC 1A11036]|uniref:DUF4435 domain-containing protein n=1 Tax=Billgrantia zhangzhouensis TaxID=2733481 RepID=A0ABS9AH83_9GAMM|nr:DUF4435 domain-containing protein [Halomonas zhangzhouensis]MCE8021084.1 DUF4435 domain-containing protein [Halomonas zhangzhouensis]